MSTVLKFLNSIMKIVKMMEICERVKKYIENVLSRYETSFEYGFDVKILDNNLEYEYEITLSFKSCPQHLTYDLYSEYIKKFETDIKKDIYEYLGKKVMVFSNIIEN